MASHWPDVCEEKRAGRIALRALTDEIDLNDDVQRDRSEDHAAEQRPFFRDPLVPLVAIGFGSSLGDRRATLELAVRRMGTAGMRLLRASRWVASPPLAGGTARNPFLNGVALYETTLSPTDVLARCRALEEAFGRRRARHWGDRTLDVDVLQYGDVVSTEAALVLPHPAIAKRPFVLGPLVEVWPDAVDPVTGAPWATVRCDARPRPWFVGVPRRP